MNNIIKINFLNRSNDIYDKFKRVSISDIHREKDLDFENIILSHVNFFDTIEIINYENLIDDLNDNGYILNEDYDIKDIKKIIGRYK